MKVKNVSDMGQVIRIQEKKTKSAIDFSVPFFVSAVAIDVSTTHRNFTPGLHYNY